MFCPVCKAEYREGFTQCKDCDVELVATLPANPDEEVRTLPPLPTASVWRGQDRETSEHITAALARVGVPSEVGVVGGHALEIRVPERAAEVAAEVIPNALSRRRSADAEAEAQPKSLECPLCWADYGPGVRFCSRCLVPLMDPDQVSPPVNVWEGDHPGDAYLANAAMRRSGIPYHLAGADDRSIPMLVPRMPLSESRYSLRVLPEDEARAREVVSEIQFPVLEEAETLPPDEPPAEEAAPQEERPGIEWIPVWSGGNAEELEALRFVFRENALPMRVEDADGFGRMQLLVPAPDEAHARAIVRQILDGEVPPELDAAPGEDAESNR